MGRGETNGSVNGFTSTKKITPDKIKKIGSIGNGSTANGGTGDQSPLLSANGEPKDACHFTYMIFYLHGIGHLLPWNFFITATEVGTVRMSSHVIHARSHIKFGPFSIASSPV